MRTNRLMLHIARRAKPKVVDHTRPLFSESHSVYENEKSLFQEVGAASQDLLNLLKNGNSRAASKRVENLRELLGFGRNDYTSDGQNAAKLVFPGRLEYNNGQRLSRNKAIDASRNAATQLREVYASFDVSSLLKNESGTSPLYRTD